MDSCHDDLVWSNDPIRRPLRSLEPVTMPEAIKSNLVEDIDNYLSPAAEKYYANRGIPWRRGYLLYGPPGTGKTSLAQAIATHFKLDIYLLDLAQPKLNDESLADLFAKLPNSCLVLIEDMDSSGIRREKMCIKKNHDDEQDAAKVTLSGLLNVIDGAAAKEGRLLLISSNEPDSLDSALVRAGRVDRKIYMGNAKLRC